MSNMMFSNYSFLILSTYLDTAVSHWYFQRVNKEYDEEGLKITGEILALNPDFSSLWNYRKEILLQLKDQKLVSLYDVAY